MDTQDERRARMMEKVRKLLAMARDGRGNANEEEIAMRQANKLMAEFGIAESEVDMAALDSGAMSFGETDMRADGRDIKAPLQSYSTWCGVLAVGVARFTDSVVTRKTTELGQRIVFRGEKNDVLFARWLFGVLAISVQSERNSSGWTGRANGNAFCLSAASTLASRLKTLASERRAAYQAAQAESGSRALVVVDRKAVIIAARFGEQRTRSSRVSSRGESGASMAGRAAGSRINIPSGRPIGSTAQRRIANV